MLSIAQALIQAQNAGLTRLEAQLLVLHAAQQPSSARAWLLTHDSDELSTQTWQTLLLRRIAGEPLAYITGWRGFYGLELQVDPRVLDPRPDTETLVDWALALALPPTAHVLDMGTGSGAIALALATQRPSWQILATDVSAHALEVARANAQRLQLGVQFQRGAWFAALGNDTTEFDLIASNPPYIADNDVHLSALRHEPIQALTSGTDGLDALRILIAGAPKHLRPGGWLLLEHGHDQSQTVRELLQAQGFTDIQSRTDLAGIERCSGGKALQHAR